MGKAYQRSMEPSQKPTAKENEEVEAVVVEKANTIAEII